MKKSFSNIVKIYILGLILIPSLFTIGRIISIQTDPYIFDGKGKYVEKSEGRPFVCAYGGFPKSRQYDYCDRKEFISNLYSYQFDFIFLSIIYFMASTVILLIVGVSILIGRVLIKIGKK